MTEADHIIFEQLVTALNKIPYFPGMSHAQDKEDTNLVIRFLEDDEYNHYSYQHVSEYSDGYATCWFHSNYYWYGEIGIRTSISQNTRNAVILEEVIQSLGLLNDSYLHEDSIFYQGFNEPQWPTDLDFLLVKLLYHPEIKPGLTYPHCVPLIRRILEEN